MLAHVAANGPNMHPRGPTCPAAGACACAVAGTPSLSSASVLRGVLQATSSATEDRRPAGWWRASLERCPTPPGVDRPEATASPQHTGSAPASVPPEPGKRLSRWPALPRRSRDDVVDRLVGE
jgi:hypothetical protein